MKRLTNTAPVSLSTSYLIGSPCIGISITTLQSFGTSAPAGTRSRLMVVGSGTDAGGIRPRARRLYRAAMTPNVQRHGGRPRARYRRSRDRVRRQPVGAKAHWRSRYDRGMSASRFMGALESVPPSPTIVEQVYRTILDAICDGRLEPGERLTQESVA